jgi:SNF2 family DNA or RNA helicase
MMQSFTNWLKEAGLDAKKHQLSGMKWVYTRETAPRLGVPGGFLCDEMGLGKTILMIGAMVVNLQQKTLIVLPKSLLQQWCGSLKKFANIDAFIYHGAKAKRATEDDLACQVVLTTYGMISVRKRKKRLIHCPLWDIEWNRIIYDEAHHMRNSKSGQHAGGCRLKANIKWMVTGTPINNGRKDFYHLCSVLGLNRTFYRNREAITNTIKDCVLYRTKKSVGIQMPPLNVEIVNVSHETPEEEQFVKNIHASAGFADVTTDNVDMAINFLNNAYNSRLPLYMLMRQGCVIPPMASDKLVQRLINRGDFDVEDVDLLACSGVSKMNAVVNKVVENKKNKGAKLIFCQFKREIAHLKDRLTAKGFNVAVIQGSTSKKDRIYALQSPISTEVIASIVDAKTTSAGAGASIIPRLINSFLSPDVLIAQIQTACEGLNLQHFNEVYFTTPHWNPAVEDQSIARSHRIGQTSPVNVYKFITNFSSNGVSLDQYCLNVQQIKREAASIIKPTNA